MGAEPLARRRKGNYAECVKATMPLAEAEGDQSAAGLISIF